MSEIAKAEDALSRLWAEAQTLELEERGFLFSLLLAEAICGNALEDDDVVQGRILHMQTRPLRRLRDAIAQRGLITSAGPLRSRVPSPFENLKYVKLYGREAIPPDLRLAVYERDGFACQECGAQRNLTCDHKIAVTSGGDNSLGNLRTLCQTCNSRKGAKSIGGAQ